VFRISNLRQACGTVPSGKMGVVQLPITPEYTQLHFYYRVQNSQKN